MGARDADVVVIVHKEEYLRGRTTEELDALFRAGAARVGVDDMPSYPTEVDGLEALVAQADAGRRGRADVPRRTGRASTTGSRRRAARVDTPETLRDKVLLAAGG